MRTMILWTLVALLVQAAPADEEFDKLVTEFNQARQAWYQELHSRKDDGSAGGTKSPMPPRPSQVFLPRFRAYAEKHAGTPEAIGALVYVINLAAPGGPQAKPGAGGGDVSWAIEQLTQHHAADAALREHLPDLQYSFYEIGKKPLIRFYERVIEVNKDKEIAATAMFNLAFTLMHAGPTRADAEQRADEKKRAARLFRQIRKEYPGTSAAERAAGYIFEMEHLQIGMKAPDLAGEDVEGHTIKLSQFRGQVVVLDFWGFW